MKLLLLITFGLAAFNTGLIWIIQVVHYPGFLRIGNEGYEAYQNFHMRSITTVVGPSMLLELICSGFVLAYWSSLSNTPAYAISLVLLVLIFVNTAFWAAPTHGKLLAGFDQELIQRLININWWRTIAWSLRAGILGYLVYKV